MHDDAIIHVRILVDDVAASVDFYTQHFVTGPGGSQVLAVDPSGNLVELFQAAGAR